MKSVLLASALAGVLLAPTAASAGPLTDDLTKCIIRSATAKDNEAFVQWAFAAMSAHPAVQPMTNITPARREELNRAMAETTERLVFKNCRNEAILAIKVDGAESAMRNSFSAFGAAAFNGLLLDPGTKAQMQAFTSDLDLEKWRKFGAEAISPGAK